MKKYVHSTFDALSKKLNPELIVIKLDVYFDIVYEDIAASRRDDLEEAISLLSVNDYADYESFLNMVEEIVLDYKWGTANNYNRRVSNEDSLYLHFFMKRLDGSRIDKNAYEVRASHHFVEPNSEKEKRAKERRRKLSGGKRCEFRNIIIEVKGISLGPVNGRPYYKKYRDALDGLDIYLSSEQNRHSE